MDVAMATKVSVAPGIAPGSALNTGGAPKMSIESPPRTLPKYIVEMDALSEACDLSLIHI